MYNYLDDISRIKIQSRISRKLDLEILERIITMSNIKKGTLNVLDFGCGDGFLTKDRFGGFQNVKVIGVDNNKKAIEIAKNQNINPNFSFSCAEKLSDLNLESFDLITSFNVLHHIPNYEIYLKELWDKLKPEGNLLIRIPEDKLKTCLPNSRAFKLLIDEYGAISNSNRFILLDLYKHLKTLIPTPKNININFQNDCNLNYDQVGIKDLFKDNFQFRLQNDTLRNLIKNQDVAKFRKMFIDKELIYINTQTLINIEK